MATRTLVRPLLIGLAVLVALFVAASLMAPGLAASRLRAIAGARGLDVSWRSFGVDLVPPRAHFADLAAVRRADGDTVFAARTLDATLNGTDLLFGHARPTALAIDHARIHAGGSAGTDADTLAPEPDPRGKPEVAERVRERANALVHALLAPARELPTLSLRDVEVTRGAEDAIRLDGLDLARHGDAIDLAANGALRGEPEVPFDVLGRWQKDDRLTARAEFKVPATSDAQPRPFVLAFDGRFTQDRHAREVRIANGSTLTMGDITARVSLTLRERGPAVAASLEADGLSAAACRRSVPASALGVLAGLEVRGTWDWHGSFALDLAKPDSVRFRADVIPHGLALDPSASRPSLQALAGPFTATIHLPHDRLVTRELSDANPHYRPLGAISPLLRDALLTNEDGGFWKHRGFNTEAIGLAIAANLRSGDYRRGAGTITMQLARNLWLGHQRTLARKAQEVVLTWLLEHETGLPKERLLEIYLNIIEWGPGVHGADEAARYYFDEDAGQVTLPEALFLTIIVPSPTRWRGRFDAAGTLRPYAREQMHFIANKMAAKGWLDPALVPPAEALGVELRGPARALFARPDSVAADSSSLAAR